MRCRKARPFQCFSCSCSVDSETNSQATFFYHYSAAHCENDRESGHPIVVKMGVIHIHDNGTNAQIINIDSFTSHPQYRSYEKYYDIALIKLKSFIRFDVHVRPACLASVARPWQKAIAIGFGKTQYGEFKQIDFHAKAGRMVPGEAYFILLKIYFIDFSRTQNLSLA